jgi:hypothetical protein
MSRRVKRLPHPRSASLRNGRIGMVATAQDVAEPLVFGHGDYRKPVARNAAASSAVVSRGGPQSPGLPS